jgi:hypothetical protein
MVTRLFVDLVIPAATAKSQEVSGLRAGRPHPGLTQMRPKSTPNCRGYGCHWSSQPHLR